MGQKPKRKAIVISKITRLHSGQFCTPIQTGVCASVFDG